MTEAELLSLIRSERESSIGFENDTELTKARANALNYYKGDVSVDIPTLENRSKVVSSDVADAIDTVSADLQDIFSGGDDVATLTAQSEQDEEAARQETDYLNYVFFQQNSGFLVLLSMIKDACLERLGIATWGWSDPTYDEQKYEGKSAVDLTAAQQAGEVSDVAPSEDGSYSFTLKRVKKPGKCWVLAFAPSDFTISADAVSVGEATYCAMRARPRAQDLKADGVDPAIVDSLPSFENTKNQTIEQARDRARETAVTINSIGDLRAVEVITHFLRCDPDDTGKPKLWKIRTGSDDTILIDKEEVEYANFAAITPYVVTHRFYGESVADRMLEIQRINTALWRMQMDSGAFALNQRLIVDETKAGDFTITDLLANEPMRPIRTKGEGAVMPLQSPGLGFDVLSTIELAKVAGEGRTGVVRNAQGLNPDTLHETAKGAMALMSAAQKRVRMIARVFAETGIKDLFLGLHRCIRENEQGQVQAPLRGKWATLQPSQWPERDGMTIHIGLGAAGRDHDAIAIQQVAGFAEQLAATPYGGQLITPKNAWNMGATLVRAVGFKNPQDYFTEPDPNAPPPEPAPDPAMAKVQAEAALADKKLQSEAQLEIGKAHLDAQTEQAKAQSKAAVDQHRNQLEAERESQRISEQMQLERFKAENARQLEVELAHIRAGAQIEVARINAQQKAAAADAQAAEVALDG